MARLYETVVLVDANREDAAIEATVQKFQDIIAAGGEVIRADRWGKRRIAYEIAGNSHADYTVFYYHANKNTLVAELERFLRLDESVLRFLTVVDNPVGVPPLQQHATEVNVPEDADLSDKED
jgi:small subunit ribosomal protein S6